MGKENRHSAEFKAKILSQLEKSSQADLARLYKIHQHELLKQLSMINKQLSLVRAQQSNTNVPLENVTNLL